MTELEPLQIVSCSPAAQAHWLALRAALWPDAAHDEHRAEMTALLREPHRFGQWLALGGAEAIGLVEASIRHDYVNGTETSPVLFLEGLYVVPQARRRGVAQALVHAAERWGVERGCREFASDASLDNDAGHRWHRAFGLEQTERVVYFRKALGR